MTDETLLSQNWSIRTSEKFVSSSQSKVFNICAFLFSARWRLVADTTLTCHNVSVENQLEIHVCSGSDRGLPAY